MNEIPQIFDRTAVQRNRARAAARIHRVAPVLEEASLRLLDRLDDTTRSFTEALDLGGRGFIAPHLAARRIAVTSLDLAAPMAARAGGLAVAGDAALLPFAPGSFDLIIACLSLHWIDDLPGALIQLRRSLRPGGLFLASLPVLPTLSVLRQALLQAELDIAGGASPRVSPFPDLQDCAGLLQRAGFALPVADVDEISLSYRNPMAIFSDLRDAGEGNALHARARRIPSRAIFAHAAAALAAAAPLEITLTLATLTGWAER